MLLGGLGRMEPLCKYLNQGCCDKNKIKSWKCQPGKCPNNVSLSNFPRGGMFACKTSIQGSETPLFSSKDHCANFNFFFVAIIKSQAGQRPENISTEAEEEVSVEENQDLILSCAFELGKDASVFTVYWFKGLNLSKCLYSASNEYGHTLFDISYNINCCIDEALRDRGIKNVTTSEEGHRKQTHHQMRNQVTIPNSTTADNGSYFCVVAAYNPGFTWTIERRVSVTVTVRKAPPPNFYLQISLGAIGGALLLMAGLILLLCCLRKAKGKPLENQQRDQTAVATEDCSPYAVSGRSDLSGQETVYSLAMSPGEAPSSRCFSSQSKPDPAVQHGENVEVLYSKVAKDRDGPSLASDSSV
ncbi:uncharacterized protein LOC116519480 [Thamnophis elegans]|uniref:uncharacterized protein LOC116519480 n=1 Tax=Thamnophis elegans TaxID=35005 RepID=UPI0013775557|nr:uncharacterized protein LOC116519480 [Thamnophis elegans]